MTTSTRQETEAAYAKYLLKNLDWARECGYDLACPICGCGIHDDTDTHDDAVHAIHAALYPEGQA